MEGLVLFFPHIVGEGSSKLGLLGRVLVTLCKLGFYFFPKGIGCLASLVVAPKIGVVAPGQ